MRVAPLFCLLVGLSAAGAAHASTLRLALNHSVRLPVAGPASSVVLGSPSVVDVSVVDSRTVFVSGKTPGSTDVTVVDPLGRIVYRGEIVVGEGATVRVFRGGALTDVACTPYCAASEGAGGSGAAAAALPAPATPVAALGGALGSGLNGPAASGTAAIGQGLSPPR